MIDLSVLVNDAANTVTLTATTDGASVTFYRRIGQAQELVLVSNIVVANGKAIYIDNAAPQKVLLTYAAVDNSYERTPTAQAVLPSTYSLSRPALRSDIRLGNLVLNTVDSDGVIWTVSDITNWWTIPDAQIPVTDRDKNTDGAYDESGRYMARSLTLSGVFYPTSPSALEIARKKLIAAFNAVRNTTSLEVDQDPPRALTVRASGKSAINTIKQNGLTQFSVDLFAADPVKYELVTNNFSVGNGGTPAGRTYPHSGGRSYPSSLAPNSVQVVNRGDYAVYPVVTILGPVTNPRVELIEPGEFMAFTLTLTLGQTLTIDCRNKSVLLNGSVSRRGTMSTDSTWLSLPTGASTFRYTAQGPNNSASKATLSYKSGWIG